MDLREVEGRKGKDVARHPWELARAEIIIKSIKEKFNPTENFKVLDMGCGDTFLVERISEKFPLVNFIAVDIAFTDKMVSDYNQQTNERIEIYQNIEDVNINSGKFDLVLLLDVIEHIEDDIKFLKELKQNQYIDSTTEFLITVPAFQSLFCNHDRFLGHYRRYTNNSLKRNIENAGFSTTYTNYFFIGLLIPRMLEVFLEKFSKNSNESTGLVEWNGGVFKTNLIRSILLFDYSFGRFINKFGIKIPGLSNIAICHPLA